MSTSDFLTQAIVHPWRPGLPVPQGEDLSCLQESFITHAIPLHPEWHLVCACPLLPPGFQVSPSPTGWPPLFFVTRLIRVHYSLRPTQPLTMVLDALRYLRAPHGGFRPERTTDRLAL